MAMSETHLPCAYSVSREWVPYWDTQQHVGPGQGEQATSAMCVDFLTCLPAVTVKCFSGERLRRREIMLSL